MYFVVILHKFNVSWMLSKLLLVVDNTKYDANLVIIPNVLSEKICTIFQPN